MLQKETVNLLYRNTLDVLLFTIVVYYGVTWCTFKPKLKKIKSVHPEKISYISGNETF